MSTKEYFKKGYDHCKAMMHCYTTKEIKRFFENELKPCLNGTPEIESYITGFESALEVWGMEN